MMYKYDYFKGNDGKYYIRKTCGLIVGLYTMQYYQTEEECIKMCAILNRG